MMRWLWRDYPRSYDVHDLVQRSFNGPAGTAAATNALPEK